MTFKISRSQTYRWPIKIRLPKDGGGCTVETFEGEFRRLKQSRIDELRRQLIAQEESGLEEGEITAEAAIGEILAGWSGIMDDDGEEVPFSPSAVAELLELPTVAMQILRSWGESLMVGADGAKGKN
jgi:hypothetical protein